MPGADDVIDQDREAVDPRAYLEGQGQFLRGDGHGVSDVTETRLGEPTSFGEGGDRNTSEMAPGLDPRRLDALVGFDVGPESHPEIMGAIGHAESVALEPVEIDQRAGCAEVLGFHWQKDSL